MKNIAIVLAILIALGLLGLWLLPNQMPSTRNISFQDAAVPDEVPQAPGPRQEGDSLPQSTDAPPESDAGMEFPISDDAGAGGSVLTYAALVSYTDEGFSPENVTIQRGDVVRFFNQSSGRMWVTTLDHDEETLYPVTNESDCRDSSFDQCAAVGSGEFWDFMFTRTGTFTYHNDARASAKGSVTVE